MITALIVSSVFALAPAVRGEGTSARPVGYAWLSFPSGIAVRKVREAPQLDQSGNRQGVGLVYLVPAGSDPFEPGLSAAVRDFLARKTPSASRVVLGAWTVNSRSTAIESAEYRAYVRQASGKWTRDEKPVGFSAPSAGLPLSPEPLDRDPVADAAARKAILAWFDAFERQDLASCWANTSGDFRQGFSEQEWRAQVNQLTTRIGTRQRRAELALEYGRIPPTGTVYVTIEYRSRYSRAGDLVERITATRCEAADRWCIMGWDMTK